MLQCGWVTLLWLNFFSFSFFFPSWSAAGTYWGESSGLSACPAGSPSARRPAPRFGISPLQPWLLQPQTACLLLMINLCIAISLSIRRLTPYITYVTQIKTECISNFLWKAWRRRLKMKCVIVIYAEVSNHHRWYCPWTGSSDRSSTPLEANATWQNSFKGSGVPHVGLSLPPDLLSDPAGDLYTPAGWHDRGRWPHSTRGEFPSNCLFKMPSVLQLPFFPSSFSFLILCRKCKNKPSFFSF